MREHFRPKTLLFYGVMIGSVLILFRATASYGERYLNAPPNLSGRYVSPDALPGCPASSRLALTLQQSGTYLNANLYSETPEKATAHASSQGAATEENLPLAGRWTPQQLTLHGTTEALVACQWATTLPPNDASDRSIVHLQGQIAQATETTFSGQLTVDGNPAPLAFTAQRQAVSPPQVAPH